MIADLPIALATPRDASAIARMSKVNIEYGLPWSWTAGRVARAIGDPNINAVVARENDGVTGFGIMRYREETAHLLLLAVHAGRRRAGIGSALLVWLEEVASVAGISSIGLEARDDNEAARAFYRAHGYREIARVPRMYAQLADGIRLEKSLRA